MSCACTLSVASTFEVVGASGASKVSKLPVQQVHYVWIVCPQDICFERFGPPVVVNSRMFVYSSDTTPVKQRKRTTAVTSDLLSYALHVHKLYQCMSLLSVSCMLLYMSIILSIAAVHPYRSCCPRSQSSTETVPSDACCTLDTVSPGPTGAVVPEPPTGSMHVDKQGAMDILDVQEPDIQQARVPAPCKTEGSLSVATWNVNALGRHMQDGEVLSVFKSVDVCVITETRMTDAQVFIDGFSCVHSPHLTRVNKAPTSTTGGVLMCVRSELMHAVITCKPIGTEGSMVHLLIDGIKLGLGGKIHIVGVYMPHRHSKYYFDGVGWDILTSFIGSLPKEDGLMLLGDMNGRIGTDVPTICWHNREVDISRCSSDVSDTNEVGKRLLSLCSTASLLPLNGLRHTAMDVYESDRFTDAFTYYTYKRGTVASVIDYVCVNSVLFPIVHDLQIADRKGRSDHFPLVCRVGVVVKPVDDEERTEVPKIGKRWSVKGELFDHEAVNSNLSTSVHLHDVMNKLHALLDGDLDCVNVSDSSGMYECMSELFDEFMECVRTSIVGEQRARSDRVSRPSRERKPARNKNKKKRQHVGEWYDNECKKIAKSMYDSMKCGDNDHKRKVHNEYRSLCRRKRARWLSDRMSAIDRVLLVDKSQMWRTVDCMLGLSSQSSPLVDVDRLRDYYCTAFNVDRNAADVLEAPALPRISTGPLDASHPHVSKEEILYVLNTVSSGKAAGIDGMRSDVLCDLRHVAVFVDALYVLVNCMIHYGFWPQEWNRVLIYPLLKTGKDPMSASSYRPIHLICVLAKAVSRLVERRIHKAVGNPECQLAYTSKHATRDNLLVLNTLIDKYKSVGMYLVFVDFTAAFDSIDRTRLIEKLRMKGALDETFLTFLSAMLTGVHASVRSAVLKWFNEGMGVKQGDPAGPRMFVTYIHDLPEWVCPDDPGARQYAAFLINQLIRCLLWADDLVLFSTSVPHAQKQIDALDSYCLNNKLLVNIPKTQVLYVSTRSNLHALATPLHTFTYRGVALQYVTRYKYVGAWVDDKGTCDVHVSELLKKVSSSSFMCMSKSRRIAFRCPPNLRILLFKSHVVSLLTYASEVIPYTQQHIKQMNKVICKYARWATGLPLHTCSNAVLREAGMRPIEYDFLQARMNYFLLVQARPESHMTRLAFADILSRESTSGLVKLLNGMRDAFSKLSCLPLLDTPGALRMNKGIIRKKVHECWLSEGGATTADLEINNKYTHYLMGIQSRDRRLDTICTTRMNVRALPVSRISMHTQVMDIRKYGGMGCIHMSTTSIKRYEQEAISLFRTGVAPAFIGSNAPSMSAETNRFFRTCPFCENMYGSLSVYDVFHVLFQCPLYASERCSMFLCLNTISDADQWDAVATVCDLGVSLLCPQSPGVAMAVGRFLSESLAAMDIYARIREVGYHDVSSRWLGERTDKLNDMRTRIREMLRERNDSASTLRAPDCSVTRLWVDKHSHESLNDAFKSIRNWLPSGWARSVEKKQSKRINSIALISMSK